MRLFSYRIAVDAGSAPNPYWGRCTLAICKPTIRRVAEVGDWVAATGSARSPIGDVSKCLVYAMRVDERMTMRDYDGYTRLQLPEKIPDWRSRDPHRWVGDSIYDFSSEPPRLRRSVHTEENRETDLSGAYVLLSDHFFYFGRDPIPLPARLRRIIKSGQGHKSSANDSLVRPFVRWLHGLGVDENSLLAEPQVTREEENDTQLRLAAAHLAEGEFETRFYC